MKPRHAAALALVMFAVSVTGCGRSGFWLLMVPPLHDGQVDANAPIKSWTTMSHPFRSLSECEHTKQGAAAFYANKQDMDKIQNMFKSFSKSQLEIGKTLLSHMTCVSSEDFRLK